jgi:hypothetical protein
MAMWARNQRDTGMKHSAATLQVTEAEEGAQMPQQELTDRIDEALDIYRSREMVSASEIVDLLLDLRLMLLAADEAAASTPIS